MGAASGRYTGLFVLDFGENAKARILVRYDIVIFSVFRCSRTSLACSASSTAIEVYLPAIVISSSHSVSYFSLVLYRIAGHTSVEIQIRTYTVQMRTSMPSFSRPASRLYKLSFSITFCCGDFRPRRPCLLLSLRP